MGIKDFITRIIPSRFRVLTNTWFNGIFGAWDLTKRNYATLIWYNICDILLDITEDVDMTGDVNASDEGKYQFAAFRAFFFAWGRTVLQALFDTGYCVIGYKDNHYYVMNANEYVTPTSNNFTVVQPIDVNVQVYVMRSSTYIVRGVSDKSLCAPWLDFLDDVCNASSTVSKRMGAVVIASPKNLTNAPTQTVLTEEQKQALEKQIGNSYGALSNQSNVMVLPREMSWQTVNLAGLDLKTIDKAKFCITAICDRIKVPANQVAIIDTNSMKTLANGSELREGDRAKYKTFRRLFERTFVQMANDLGIRMVYTITGEPAEDTNKTPTATE